eukprot:7189924-Prymnesium_polylepis.1
MQLLAELRALGAKVNGCPVAKLDRSLARSLACSLACSPAFLMACVVHASFSSITIVTDKAGLKEGSDYIDFLLTSIRGKQ